MEVRVDGICGTGWSAGEWALAVAFGATVAAVAIVYAVDLLLDAAAIRAIPKSEIDGEALGILRTYPDPIIEARQREWTAWHHCDDIAQGRARRVRRAVQRFVDLGLPR
jgi:hypothetical protein